MTKQGKMRRGMHAWDWNQNGHGVITTTRVDDHHLHINSVIEVCEHVDDRPWLCLLKIAFLTFNDVDTLECGTDLAVRMLLDDF